jgi:hypothetical protein
VDESPAAEQERARLRQVVDLVRQALRGTGGARVVRADSGWEMSADGVIGAPAAWDEQDLRREVGAPVAGWGSSRHRGR